MTYRCEFESISEFRLLEGRVGGKNRLSCEWGLAPQYYAVRSGSTEGGFGAARGELADDWREK